VHVRALTVPSEEAEDRRRLVTGAAVFPTLTVLNALLGGLLDEAPMVLRTLVLATIAVPIIIYGLMPPLHRVRARVVAHLPAQ
jgi:antibiotic biosynthesis monooxygenase (ABM) superfamily enzyme